MGAWSVLSNAYLLTILAAAARHRRSVEDGSIAAPELLVVALVPAYNEEAAIATSVRCLVQQDHPAHRREVVVIADNCTDKTSDRAREAGATVWERSDPENRGKGQALAWAIERVWATWPDVDAVAVVDADCVVTPGLLSGFASKLAAGASAVQADNVVETPQFADAAARRWAGFALMHHVRATGKQALGFSCGLYGTGMAFGSDLLRALPWQSFSVTEDSEYHIRIVESGRRVVFLTGESVSSAMPSSEAAAHHQQMRWETGKASLARRTVPRLFVSGVRTRDKQLLHAGLEQLVPPQSLLVVLTAAASVIGFASRDRKAVALGACAGVGQSVYVVGGLCLARAPAPVWRSLLAAPKLIVRKVFQAAAIGTGRGSADWVRTARDLA